MNMRMSGSLEDGNFKYGTTLLVILSVAIVGAGVFLFSRGAFHQTKEGVYVTLLTETSGLRNFFLDLNEGKLHPINKEEEGVKNTSLFLAKSFDGNRYAYATLEEDIPMQIYATRVNGGSIQISRNDIQYKREPRWSRDDTQVVYVAQGSIDAEKTGPRLPEDWTIYVASADGSGERMISKGYAPVFSPDSRSILFLRNDGLYLTEVSGKDTPVQVWSIDPSSKGIQANSSMKLSLSRDGTALLWSNPGFDGFRGQAAMFQIEDWDPFSARIAYTISLPLTYAAFSPAGENFVALSQVTKERPAIEGGVMWALVFETRTGKLLQTIKIPKLQFGQNWIQTWGEEEVFDPSEFLKVFNL